MIKNVYTALLVFFFIGCSIKFEDGINQIKIKDAFIKKELTIDSCTIESFIAQIDSKNYGRLFVEYIDLDIGCTWNGLSRGFFEDLLKDELDLKSLKTVERYDYKNYEFTTYLVNGKYYLNLIYEFSSFEDKFILDYEGKYFTKMVKEFDNNYVNRYLNKDRFSSNYNESLVDKNIIRNYFHQESNGIDILND